MPDTRGFLLLHLICILTPPVIPHQLSSQSNTGVPTTVTFPSGYIHFPTINAGLKVHRERSNWYNANTACASEGGRLAVVDTPEKIRYVKENKAQYSEVWVGITRDSPHWVTADNRSERPDLPWEANSPDGIGDCAVVNVRGDGLSNKLCAWRKPFACEILATTTSVQQTPIMF